MRVHMDFCDLCGIELDPAKINGEIKFYKDSSDHTMMTVRICNECFEHERSEKEKRQQRTKRSMLQLIHDALENRIMRQ